jgi:hypothetical protein
VCSMLQSQAVAQTGLQLARFRSLPPASFRPRSVLLVVVDEVIGIGRDRGRVRISVGLIHTQLLSDFVLELFETFDGALEQYDGLLEPFAALSIAARQMRSANHGIVVASIGTLAFRRGVVLQIDQHLIESLHVFFVFVGNCPKGQTVVCLTMGPTYERSRRQSESGNKLGATSSAKPSALTRPDLH